MEKGLWGRLELERWLEGGQENSLVPRKGLVCDSGVDMHDHGILPIVYGSGPCGAECGMQRRARSRSWSQGPEGHLILRLDLSVADSGSVPGGLIPDTWIWARSST